MEAVIFVGVQASGKSSFYLERFFRTHVRLNLDMLRTRHRLDILLRACLEAKQPFVLDNTNPTVHERAQYLGMARAAGFRAVAYYFQSSLQECIRRNNARDAKQRILVKGIVATFKRLQPPRFKEGFTAMYSVRIAADGGFVVEAWADDLTDA